MDFSRLAQNRGAHFPNPIHGSSETVFRAGNIGVEISIHIGAMMRFVSATLCLLAAALTGVQSQSGVPAGFDCKTRQLAMEYAVHIQPWRSSADFEVRRSHMLSVFLVLVLPLVCPALEFVFKEQAAGLEETEVERLPSRPVCCVTDLTPLLTACRPLGTCFGA
jgi:hypothetical protein